MLRSRRLGRLTAYASAALGVAIANVLTSLMRTVLAPSVSLLFFPAILLPAMYGGYGPALFATVLSTISLAFFFVAPANSLSIGLDDGLRLSVFVAVACATAWLSSERRRAETAQRQSLQELQGAVNTLRKVSGWPILLGADTAAGVRRMLAHAASVVGSRSVVVAWESEEEPWIYVAGNAATGPIAKYPPGELPPLSADLVERFQTANLSGRVFFSGLQPAGPEVTPVAQVVAREVGNSLDQLYLAERLREVAVQQERMRVSRDLHDGVLQALTGIRLELQAFAQDSDAPAAWSDRLLAIERAIAIEQRELRLLIQELKPSPGGVSPSGQIAQRLEEMCARLGTEWQTPITMRVDSTDLQLSPAVEEATRLMVHEAVINALKHANPSRVTVVVQEADAWLTVVVSDDGRGFSFQGRMEHDALVRFNVGPVTLRERIAALNGRLTIESTGKGSRLEFAIPLGPVHV